VDSEQQDPYGPHDPQDLRHDELSDQAQARLRQAVTAIILLGVGILAGLWLAPDTPSSAKTHIESLQTVLAQREAQIGELEQLARAPDPNGNEGHLRAKDRARHQKEGRAYIAALRRTGAQGAANLVQWFIGRWDQLLDAPQADDRTGRRAATLALLVGGMAANLNPGDYVPWQAEFLNNGWLGELHLDIDGDGLPGPRKGPNAHDGFANVSVCHVAMALNQAMTDGQILMMPEMRCDRPDSRMSVFLQGETFDDALNEFVRAVREQGFLVMEKNERGGRLVLVGSKPVPVKEEDL
jgi:hypothetical protein